MSIKIAKRLLYTFFISGALAGEAKCQTVPQNAPINEVQVMPPSANPQDLPDIYDAQLPLNFIRTWQPKKPLTDETDVVSTDRTVSEVGRATQYFDGLGRSLQTVGWQVLPDNGDGANRSDLVAPVLYDEFGREPYKYLPYASGSSDGEFKTNPFAQQLDFYQGTYPHQQKALLGERLFYSKTQYEASPLSRVEKTFAPGNEWAGSEGARNDEHSVSVQYLVNSEKDDVQMWTIGFDDLSYKNNDVTTNTPSSTGRYPTGQLYKTVTADEQKNQVIEYKDEEGHVVLKKVQAGATDDGDPYTGWLLTYYVYDDLGQLRFVMPPKAVTALQQNNWQFTDDVTNELCFRYEYDERQRICAKKVPGAGWVYMIYDSRDRMVFSQDANMRSNGQSQWMYTLYDLLNRAVETGITEIDLSADALQQKQNEYDANNAHGTYDEITEGTTVDSKPFRSTVTVCDEFFLGDDHTAMTLTYYDDYSQTNKVYFTDGAHKANHAEVALHDPNVYPQWLPDNASEMTIGTVTSTRTRVLEDPKDLKQGGWLEAATFYDDKGRAVQVNSDNYARGADIATSLYDFTGKVVSTHIQHTNLMSVKKPQTEVLTTIRFDEGGRLLEVHKETDGDAASDRVIASYQYDAMGQVWDKHLGQKRDEEGHLSDGEPLEDQNYSYNIRGWLKGINWNYGDDARDAEATTPQQDAGVNKWFSLDLSYDWGYDKNQWNGNIAGMRWQSGGDGVQRGYGYGYDAANRLLYGDFNQQIKDNSEPVWDKLDPASSIRVDFSMMMGKDGSGTSAYDENGNILQMQQKGLFFAAGGAQSDWIDQLTYRYATQSTDQTNKLSLVHDEARHGGSGNLGDFTDYDNGGNDYSYDDNGNLTGDWNKHIKHISYNYLNLPSWIEVVTDDGSMLKGTITYIYDATGNKLQKQTEELASDANGQIHTITTTTYCGGFVYEQKSQGQKDEEPKETEPATLQYVSHEEGRLRILDEPSNKEDETSRYAYDYFIKDHLGNVRMVLTDEWKQEVDPTLSWEGDNSASPDVIGNQNAVWDNKDGGSIDVEQSRAERPSGMTAERNGTYVRLTNKDGGRADNRAFGAGRLLRVMAGDRINTAVDYYWQKQQVDNTSADGVSTLLQSLGSALLGSSSPLSSPTKEMVSGITSKVSADPGIFSSLTRPQSPDGDASLPKAYLYVLLFDENFTFDPKHSTIVRVGEADATTLLPASVRAGKNGYAYVYCANESNNTVYFDNFQMNDMRGPITEETHYYPFGLQMVGISSQALDFGGSENNKLYNKGSELQHHEFSDGTGLEEYDTRYRQLDPQLGRWNQVDPKTESQEDVSPYQAMTNDPVRNNDPLGDEPDGCCGFWNGIKNVAYSIGGYSAAVVDNATAGIINLRGALAPDAGDADAVRAFNGGQDAGDISSVIGGDGETGAGGGLVTGSVTVTGASGGLAVEVTAPTAVAGGLMMLHGQMMTAEGANNLAFQKGRVEATNNSSNSSEGSTKGAAKGSLNETKNALSQAKEKIGLKPNESLPKEKQGKYGSPQRGDSRKGYRLDPAHPNARSGSGEEYPHVNYWDYTKGKRGNGGVNGAIPIKN